MPSKPVPVMREGFLEERLAKLTARTNRAVAIGASRQARIRPPSVRIIPQWRQPQRIDPETERARKQIALRLHRAAVAVELSLTQSSRRDDLLLALLTRRELESVQTKSSKALVSSRWGCAFERGITFLVNSDDFLRSTLSIQPRLETTDPYGERWQVRPDYAAFTVGAYPLYFDVTAERMAREHFRRRLYGQEVTQITYWAPSDLRTGLRRVFEQAPSDGAGIHWNQDLYSSGRHGPLGLLVDYFEALESRYSRQGPTDKASILPVPDRIWVEGLQVRLTVTAQTREQILAAAVSYMKMSHPQLRRPLTTREVRDAPRSVLPEPKTIAAKFATAEDGRGFAFFREALALEMGFPFTRIYPKTAEEVLALAEKYCIDTYGQPRLLQKSDLRNAARIGIPIPPQHVVKVFPNKNHSDSLTSFQKALADHLGLAFKPMPDTREEILRATVGFFGESLLASTAITEELLERAHKVGVLPSIAAIRRRFRDSARPGTSGFRIFQEQVAERTGTTLRTAWETPDQILEAAERLMKDLNLSNRLPKAREIDQACLAGKMPSCSRITKVFSAVGSNGDTGFRTFQEQLAERTGVSLRRQWKSATEIVDAAVELCLRNGIMRELTLGDLAEQSRAGALPSPSTIEKFFMNSETSGFQLLRATVAAALGLPVEKDRWATRDAVLADAVQYMRSIDKSTVLITQSDINTASKMGALPSLEKIAKMFAAPEFTNGYLAFQSAYAQSTGYVMRRRFNSREEILEAAAGLLRDGEWTGLPQQKDIAAASKAGQMPSVSALLRAFGSSRVSNDGWQNFLSALNDCLAPDSSKGQAGNTTFQLVETLRPATHESVIAASL